MMFETAYIEFLDEMDFRGNSPATKIYYSENLLKFRKFCSKEIEELTEKDIREYIIDCRRRGNSPNSIQTYYRALRAFFNFCVQRDYLETSPMACMVLPKGYKKIVRILSTGELVTLFNTLDNDRDRLLVLLMLDSGLRTAECLRLKLSDIQERSLVIRGKGSKERIVPLSSIARSMLVSYCSSKSSSDTVFVLSANAVKKLFQRLKKQTGITRLHAHLLRHTFATLYIMNGGDLISLQQILGHSSIEMVRRYSHLASYYLISKHEHISCLSGIFSELKAK